MRRPGGRKTQAATGAGPDGRPRTIDRWHQAGRERAMIEILGLVMSARASGLDDGEIVADVETVAKGALVVSAADFIPGEWLE